MKLSLVQSDVGRSRAWLRLALNEGVLTRYLEAMRTDGQRTLRYFLLSTSLLLFFQAKYKTWVQILLQSLLPERRTSA